jgi:hypothetical protein
MLLRVGTTAAVLAAIGILMLYPVDDLDVWWLLAGGRYMVETRTFPTTDPFSGPAQGAEWLNHAWGFELLLYGVWQAAGPAGLVVFQALVAVATFAVLYLIARGESVGHGWALLVVGAAGVATRGFWAPRPQLATYFLLALFWAILRAYGRGRADRLIWLPVLTAVWANLHGGFMVGPALIGLVLLGEVVDRATGAEGALSDRRLGRLAAAGGLSLVAMLATPFHYRAVLFPLHVLSDRLAQAFIVEWKSPAFHYGQTRLIEGLILLTLLALCLVARRPRASDVVVVAAFLHFGLQAVRNLPLLVVVLVPVLAAAFASIARERVPALVALTGWSSRRVAVGALAVALAATVWWNYPARGVPSFWPRAGLADIYPAEAVEFVQRARPPGPLFNDYGWGGYLIWRLYPDYRVSIDGRAAVHGPRRFADHIEVSEVRAQWRQKLEESGARLVVTQARSTLAIVLRVSPDWEVLHEDRIAVVFGKRGVRT